jgi:hypothetical protein
MFSWRKSKRDPVDAGNGTAPPQDLRCSFCNKDQADVRKLIAGPAVFICYECVDIFVDINSQERDKEVPDGSAADLRPTGVEGRLRRSALACGLCGTLTLAHRVLPLGDRGVLCGECADAVEDTLSRGRPAPEAG